MYFSPVCHVVDFSEVLQLLFLGQHLHNEWTPAQVAQAGTLHLGISLLLYLVT